MSFFPPPHPDAPKLPSQQAKSVPRPPCHPKIPTALNLRDLQRAVQVRRFKLFGVHCTSGSQSCSPCPGAERGDLSQALAAAGTSQSSWIIKQWSFLLCLCIPNTCRSESKGRKFVWTVRKFSQGKFSTRKITIFSGKEQWQFLFHLSCYLHIFGKKCWVVNDQTDNSPLPTNNPSRRMGEIKWMDEDCSPGVV